MNVQQVAWLTAGVVLIVAIIMFRRVNAKFHGFSLKGDNNGKINHVEIKGHNNENKQSIDKGSKDLSQENKIKIVGNENINEQNQ